MSKMTKSEAGKLGAAARTKKYRNPGTPEGRQKGGMNSLKTHRKMRTNFQLAKPHIKPPDSSRLAECLGILIGDGHIAKYQVSMVTSSKTDLEHAFYVANLMTELFGIEPTVRFKMDCNAVEIILSSINLGKWLSTKGMPIGNKIKNGLSIPNWIYTKIEYQHNFIRGLFDTDGCVYIDTHTIKGKKYQNLGWTITSYSAKLRSDVFELLRTLGYSPTVNLTQKSVYMRRRADIDRYFQEIGSSNSKHLKRYGRVPKRS